MFKVLIREFKGLKILARYNKRNALGDEAAAYLKTRAEQAVERYRDIRALCHDFRRSVALARTKARHQTTIGCPISRPASLAKRTRA